MHVISKMFCFQKLRIFMNLKKKKMKQATIIAICLYKNGQIMMTFIFV